MKIRYNADNLFINITRWHPATYITILMINHWMACCMVNAKVLNLTQLPITCIYELQLRKTEGGLKVFGHDFQI